MMKQPLLSFCIPTYNRSGEIHRCVTDLLSHPSKEIEVIVSDNASADDTFSVLSGISDARLKLFRNSENIGMIANMCSALNQGTGKYALMMSDEDRVILEHVDAVLHFLRTVKDEYAMILFGMQGYVTVSTDQPYVIPAGPEATSFVFSCTDVAGSLVNKSIINNLDVGKYHRAGTAPWSGYSDAHLGDWFLEASKHYPIYRSEIILVERRYVEGLYWEAEEMVELGRKGYDSLFFSPESLRVAFEKQIKIIKGMYGGTKHEHPMYQNLLKFVWLDLCYSTSLPLFTNSNRLATLFRHPVYRPEYVKKWGSPWNLVRTVTTRAVRTVREVSGSPVWDSIGSLLENFFQGNLEMPVCCYDETARYLAGDLIYSIGVESTDNDYTPYDVDVFYDAEFPQTNEMFYKLRRKQYESVIRTPALKTKRDYYLRAEAHLHLGDRQNAREMLEQYLHYLHSADTLGAIINGFRGEVFALWFLGCMSQFEGDYSRAMDYVSRCRNTADIYLQRNELRNSRLGILGLKFVETGDWKNRVAQRRMDLDYRRSLREMNRLEEETQ